MSGCVEADNLLSRSALNRFGELLSQQRYIWREACGYVAVDFTDGCDSFFFRVSDSSISPDISAKHALDEFERINRKRSQVLNGFRHLALEKGIALRRSASGIWNTQSGCVSSSVQVGPALTRLAKDTAPEHALLRLIEGQYFSGTDVSQAVLFVKNETAPANELRWKQSDEIEPAVGPGILSLDCSVVDDPEFEPQSAEEFVEKLAPTFHSSGQSVVNGVVERVGRNRFSINLFGKGIANLSFSDRLDDYQIAPQGKRMARLIDKLGTVGAIEHLVQEFRALDEGRGQTLTLIQTVMAKHGFFLCEGSWANSDWTFGKTHQEFNFSVKRQLTLNVQRYSPVQIVHDWLKRNRPFEPLPDLALLQQIAETEKLLPKRKNLPVRPLHEEAKRLPDLQSFSTAVVDRIALAHVGEGKNIMSGLPVNQSFFGFYYPLALWVDSLWYRRGKDYWADETWWLKIATRHWEEGRDQWAALVLMLNGNMEPKAVILEQMKQYDCWYSEAFIDPLVWFLVDDLPWPIDQWDELPQFSNVLGSPPLPVARRAAMRCRECLEAAKHSVTQSEQRENRLAALDHAEKLDEVSAQVWLRSEEVEHLRQACIEWASQDDPMCLRQDVPLTVAARFGWSEVADALAANPAFVGAQFETKELCFEPGKLALRISLIKPCALAARFAAVAMEYEDEAIMEKRVVRMAGTSDHQALGSMRSCLLQGQRMDQFAGAIAWLRCKAETPDLFLK